MDKNVFKRAWNMAMMGKFAYHVTIRNVASAVYAKICDTINDHWGTNLNRKFMKVDT